jgi:hypothetical protein
MRYTRDIISVSLMLFLRIYIWCISSNQVKALHGILTDTRGVWVTFNEALGTLTSFVTDYQSLRG